MRTLRTVKSYIVDFLLNLFIIVVWISITVLGIPFALFAYFFVSISTLINTLIRLDPSGD